MKSATQSPAFVEVRGPSGRLYGRLDPQRMVIEFKTGRGGQSGQHAIEVVDLKPYLVASQQVSE